jgi:hypothetical protein
MNFFKAFFIYNFFILILSFIVFSFKLLVIGKYFCKDLAMWRRHPLRPLLPCGPRLPQPYALQFWQAHWEAGHFDGLFVEKIWKKII